MEKNTMNANNFGTGLKTEHIFDNMTISGLWHRFEINHYTWVASCQHNRLMLCGIPKTIK